MNSIHLHEVAQYEQAFAKQDQARYQTHLLVVAKHDLSAFHHGSRSVAQSLVTKSGGVHRRYLNLVQAAEQYADARHLSLVVTRHEPPRFYADGNELVVKELVPLTSTSNHDN